MSKLDDLRVEMDEARVILDLMYQYLNLFEKGKIKVSVAKINQVESLEKIAPFTTGEKNALKNEFALGVQALKDTADEMQAILP